MRTLTEILCAIRVLGVYFILYLFLNVTVIAAFEKDQNNSVRIRKPQQLLNKPVYTFVKTDKHANIKWGVRHYVPRLD